MTYAASSGCGCAAGGAVCPVDQDARSSSARQATDGPYRAAGLVPWVRSSAGRASSSMCAMRARGYSGSTGR